MSAMFIIVKFGDCEEALFNHNCQIIHLLEDIKRRCGCAREVLVDLSDIHGCVRCLIDNQKSNAKDFLKDRETFILVKVEKLESNERPVYTPLLDDKHYITSEFLETLSRLPSAGNLELSGRQLKQGRQGTKNKMSRPFLTVNTSAGSVPSNSMKNPISKQRKISHSKR